MKFLESAVDLQRLNLSGRVGCCPSLPTLPSSATIEALDLGNLHKQVVCSLLSFEYARLAHLRFYGIGSQVSIPKCMLKALWSFAMPTTYSEHQNDHLKKVINAPHLGSLHLGEEGMKGLGKWGKRDCFEAIEGLQLLINGMNYSEGVAAALRKASLSIIKALRNGCFPHLRRLEIEALLGPRLSALRAFEPALIACARALEEICFCSFHSLLAEDDISTLRGLQSFWDFELNFSMRGFDGHLPLGDMDHENRSAHAHPSISMAPIANLSCLRNLHISNRSICNIQMLYKLPKLKEAAFWLCQMDAAEMFALKDELSAFRKVNFEKLEVDIADAFALHGSERD